MEALWEKSPASVGEVADTIGKERSIAYNTVLTILRILERKGYVRHTKDGRAFLYRPTVERDRRSEPPCGSCCPGSLRIRPNS